MSPLLEKARLLVDPSKLLEIHPLRLESLLVNFPPFILWAAKELAKKPKDFSEKWGGLIAHKALSLALAQGFPIKGPFLRRETLMSKRGLL